jgi:hypothetical protein
MLLALVLFACSPEYSVSPKPVEEVPPPNTDPVTETFVIEGAPADILFYGDTSFSMRRELETLADNLDVFADRLGDLSSNWQLLAVTGPTGCGIGGILTPDTEDYGQKFSDGIQTPPSDDSQDEMGLQNVAAAIAEANGGCNDGFLRDEASLHIIILSDEDDESPGAENGGAYWADYVDRIIAAKGDPELVTFSAIGGPLPSGCGDADPALGYHDAVLATNGEFLSICDEWDGELGTLANLSVTRDTFVLFGTPEPSSIEVRVDDVLVDTWAWSVPDNAVVFLSDAPRGGQSVAITFVPYVESTGTGTTTD